MVAKIGDKAVETFGRVANSGCGIRIEDLDKWSNSGETAGAAAGVTVGQQWSGLTVEPIAWSGLTEEPSDSGVEGN